MRRLELVKSEPSVEVLDQSTGGWGSDPEMCNKQAKLGKRIIRLEAHQEPEDDGVSNAIAALKEIDRLKNMIDVRADVCPLRATLDGDEHYEIKCDAPISVCNIPSLDRG